MPRFEVQGRDGSVFEIEALDENAAVAGFRRYEQMGTALQNADAVGDVPAARTLAGAIVDQRKQMAPTPVMPDQARAELARRELARRQGSGTQAAPTQQFRDGVPIGGDGASPPAGRAPRDLFAPEGDMTLEQRQSLAIANARRRRAESESGLSGDGLPPLPAGAQAGPWDKYQGQPAPQGGPWDKYQRQGAAATDDGDWWKDAPVVDDGSWWKNAPLASPQAASPHFGGAAMNATAGANESLYGVLGAPVDLMRGGMNLASRGINAVAGTDLPQIPEDSFGGSRSIAGMMGGVAPQLDPRNTVAASATDQVARGIGQGVGGAVAPAGIVGGLARTGIIGPQAARMGEAAFGRAGSASNAFIGGVSGGGAAIGQQMAPEGYESVGNFIGGLAGGVAGAGGVGMAGLGRGLVDPFTSGGRDRIAGNRLLSGSSDPQALRQSLVGTPDAAVPGSQPTTFQRTGDLGLGVMEKDAANRSPEAFAQRRADQNEARVGAMRGIAPDGAPEKVAASVRQRLDEIEAESERLLGGATDEARARAGAIGAPMTPDVAGGNIRGGIEAARAQAKERERALWSAVDPDGTMTLGLSNTRKSAHDIAEDLTPLAQPMTEVERQIYGAIGSAGETVPLRAMRDLQSNLKAAMRSERMANGESPVYRRLAIVAGGIAKDFDDAVAGRVAKEAKAVQRGEMRSEDTIAAVILRQREAWFAERSARAQLEGGGSGLSGSANGGSSPISGLRGAASEAGRGSLATSGNSRLPGNLGGGSFDRAALDRLNEANVATRERVQTFDNGTLGPIRRRPSTNSPYDMPAGIVPQRIFNASPRSFEAIGQLRTAIGDQAATDAIQGYAAGDVLRVAGRADGTLDPAKLATWRRAHADALRALPGLDARLADAGRASEAIAQVATARKAAADMAQKGALGRLVGVDAPEDVTRIVGGVFSAQDSVRRMQAIRQAVGSDPEALQGLRRAVVEHMNAKFVGTVEVGASGMAGMKSDGFQTFVRQNRATLEAAGFSRTEIETLDAVAFDLQRSGRSISGVKNPGGSDTVQNFFASLRGDTPFKAAARLLAAPGGVGLGVGAASGTTTGLAAGAAVGLFTAMRNAGLRTVDDLVTDALLNPERARLLLSKIPAGEEGARLQALARSFSQSAARALASEDDAGDRRGLQVTIRPPERRSDNAIRPNAFGGILGISGKAAPGAERRTAARSVEPVSDDPRAAIAQLIGSKGRTEPKRLPRSQRVVAEALLARQSRTGRRATA